jgi:hypothetical protein
LVFTVTVGGQQSEGTDSITFPVTPSIDRVSGCTDVANATTNCPTAGGTVITLYGRNFVRSSTSALTTTVGGVDCAGATPVDGTGSTQMTCTLRDSNGGTGVAVAVVALGQPSVARSLLSFANPAIDQIIGCNDCPTAGGSPFTLIGSNFGASDLIVLIGSLRASSVVHDAGDPHGLVTGRLPSDVGPKSVLVLQAGGGILDTATPVQVAYHECPPGTEIDGKGCRSCTAGRFAGSSSTQQCVACPAGTFSERTNGSTSCLPCEAGTASAGGQSACGTCTAGYAVSARRQSACNPCAPGEFQSVNGSSACQQCKRFSLFRLSHRCGQRFVRSAALYHV